MSTTWHWMHRRLAAEKCFFPAFSHLPHLIWILVFPSNSYRTWYSLINTERQWRARLRRRLKKDPGNMSHISNTKFSMDTIYVADLEEYLIDQSPSRGHANVGGKITTSWPRWSGTRFCWLRFGMFHHPAWAVCSYSSGPPAEGTPQI